MAKVMLCVPENKANFLKANWLLGIVGGDITCIMNCMSWGDTYPVLSFIWCKMCQSETATQTDRKTLSFSSQFRKSVLFFLKNVVVSWKRMCSWSSLLSWNLRNARAFYNKQEEFSCVLFWGKLVCLMSILKGNKPF